MAQVGDKGWEINKKKHRSDDELLCRWHYCVFADTSLWESHQFRDCG